MKHDDPLRDDEQRVDRAVRRAFAGASELSPRSDDDARIEAAIARTLQVRVEKPPSRSTPRMTVYLVAAALCVGALAYAAVHQRFESTPGPTVEVAPAPAPVPTDETSRGRELASAAAAPPPREPETVTPDLLPSVVPPSRTSGAVRALTTAKAAQPADETLGPAELFARANAARRANDTTAAIALYEELQSKFPDSHEASTSRVALGRLLLDRAGEPSRARALFSGYLDRDPAGPLAEEARAGRALAAMRLGDRDGERAAWHELLERHPSSVHAERARQRLSELGN